MTEREIENQMHDAERVFEMLVVGWRKCPSMCPFSKSQAPYAYAHWRELEARHLKNELSREVKAA